MRSALLATSFLILVGLPLGCGDDEGSEATDRGVGAACATTDDCRNDESSTDGDAVDPATVLECLSEFKGGYCGLKDCTAHDDCPDGSLCATYDNGTNYCFLTCGDKPDCNVHRAEDEESNCVSNLTLIDGSKSSKVCVPPLGN